MAAMHVESHGSGAPLVLIHGWGMHGGVWDNVVPQLAQHFSVHCVDLPGHGYSSGDKGQGASKTVGCGELANRINRDRSTMPLVLSKVEGFQRLDRCGSFVTTSYEGSAPVHGAQFERKIDDNEKSIT